MLRILVVSIVSATLVSSLFHLFLEFEFLLNFGQVGLFTVQTIDAQQDYDYDEMMEEVFVQSSNSCLSIENEAFKSLFFLKRNLEGMPAWVNVLNARISSSGCLSIEAEDINRASFFKVNLEGLFTLIHSIYNQMVANIRNNETEQTLVS